MAVEFVDRAYLLIDGQEVKCEEISYSLTRDGHDVVKTMNRANRAEGYSGGVVMAELSMTVPERKEGMPVDLDAMFVAGTLFVAVIEYEGGDIKTFRDCKFKSMDVATRQGDKATRTASADALRFSFD